jgi:FolB domain-containing protein
MEHTMDKILIKDLLVRGVIGISDREREQSQDILINIIAYTDISKAAQSDSIDDCVNYRTLTKRVKAYAEQANTFTVEALASRIADLCFEDKLIQGVLVRVEKPGAVRFSRSVGVEIERFKP